MGVAYGAHQTTGMQFESRISTYTDKMAALEDRKNAENALASQIDRALRIVDDESDAGCNFCFFFRRLGGTHGIGRLKPAAYSTSVGAATGVALGDVKKAPATGTSAQRALFGMKKKKVDPNAKLQEAAEAMAERIRGLEYRAIEGKKEAAALMKSGNKAAAMRALKKAKAVEKQVEQNQQALDAVECQVDMMAQAAIQSTVTAALTTSSAGLKGNKEMLKKAETAIDDATEARDMAEDLNGVMTEFATSATHDVDEDDLLAELRELMAGDDEPPPPAAMEDPQLAAMRKLEAAHAALDDADRLRKALPAAGGSGGRKKPEEKQGLLLASAM